MVGVAESWFEATPEPRAIACGPALIVTVPLSATELEFLRDKIVCRKTIGSAMIGSTTTTRVVARACPTIGLTIVGRKIVCRKTISPMMVGLRMMGDEIFAREILRSEANAPTVVEFELVGRCAPAETRVAGREMIASEIV